MDENLHQAAETFIQLMVRLRQLAPQQPPPHIAGLTPSQMAILDFVAASPDCGVKEIARGLKLSPPSVSVSVRQLETQGLLARKPHPRDRRAVQIALTPQGQALHEQAYAFRLARFEPLLAKLTPDERATLLALLEKALS